MHGNVRRHVGRIVTEYFDEVFSTWLTSMQPGYQSSIASLGWTREERSSLHGLARDSPRATIRPSITIWDNSSKLLKKFDQIYATGAADKCWNSSSRRVYSLLTRRAAFCLPFLIKDSFCIFTISVIIELSLFVLLIVFLSQFVRPASSTSCALTCYHLLVKITNFLLLYFM